MFRDIFPGPMYERLAEIPTDVVGGQILNLAFNKAQESGAGGEEEEPSPPVHRIFDLQPERLEDEEGYDMRLPVGEVYLSEYDTGIFERLYPYEEYNEETGSYEDRELFMTRYNPLGDEPFAELDLRKKSVFEITIPLATVAGKSIFSFLFFFLVELTYGIITFLFSILKFLFTHLTWLFDSPLAGWIFLPTLQWYMIYLVTGLRTPSITIPIPYTDGVNLGHTFIEPVLNWEFNPGNYTGTGPDSQIIKNQIDTFFEILIPDWDSPCELEYRCIKDTNLANEGKYNGVTFIRPRGMFEFLWYLLGQEEVEDTINKMTNLDNSGDCVCSGGKEFLNNEESFLYKYLHDRIDILNDWLTDYDGVAADLIREGWLSTREEDGEQIFRIDDKGGIYPAMDSNGHPKYYDPDDKLLGINIK